VRVRMAEVVVVQMRRGGFKVSLVFVVEFG
jgi:hypothetical protein